MSATNSHSAVLGPVPYPITRDVADRFIGETPPPDRAAVAIELVRLADGWEEVRDILRAYDAAQGRGDVGRPGRSQRGKAMTDAADIRPGTKRADQGGTSVVTPGAVGV